MYSSIIFLLLLVSGSQKTIVDFNKKSNLNGWRVVDDVVMGGRSSGNIRIDNKGFFVFEGSVSLENNGGFSSVRYAFDKMNVEKFTKMVIRLKGDGKDYQFRIKDKSSKYYSYIYTFSTNKKWENIEIPLSEFYPSFRGRKLDIPNFAHSAIEEIAILIANKENEDFKLLVDKINLEK
ncbi:CIA30 family protein [Candidatus Kapabacteria bacterium]|nr:CIA30 family protein [Candidatus Kapabacteria bacterium]